MMRRFQGTGYTFNIISLQEMWSQQYPALAIGCQVALAHRCSPRYCTPIESENDACYGVD